MRADKRKDKHYKTFAEEGPESRKGPHTEAWAKIPPSLKALIVGLLQIDPKKRWTAQDVCAYVEKVQAKGPKCPQKSGL